MTSSSSPGISLKSEGVSYIAGSDLPCVIINVQRGGPASAASSPRRPTTGRPQRLLGHGDFQLLVFAPSTVQEMAELVCDAFNLGDLPHARHDPGRRRACQMMEPVSFDSLPKPLPMKPWAATGTQLNANTMSSTRSISRPISWSALILDRYARYEIIKEKKNRAAERYMADDAEIIVVAYGLTSRIVAVVKEARAKGIKRG